MLFIVLSFTDIFIRFLDLLEVGTPFLHMTIPKGILSTRKAPKIKELLIEHKKNSNSTTRGHGQTNDFFINLAPNILLHATTLLWNAEQVL